MSGVRYRPEMLQEMPDHETEYLKQYEHWFITEPEQLKRMADHFVMELERGLSKEVVSLVVSCASVSKIPVLTPGSVMV